MFRGINAVNLDSKGRMAIPTKFRDELQSSIDGPSLVVTIDTDSLCLLLYPLKQWELIEEKLQALPSFNPEARRIQRLLIGHASDLEIDSNGRILLPALLRDYARLEKKMMLIGQGKKFEIWDEAQWVHERERWLAEEASAETALPDEVRSLSL
jgi:MraZ protein